MTLKIISNEERVKTVTGVKMVIFGPYGIGKTSLLKTLDESTTLCLDFEAGLLAVQDWKGDSISVRTWNEARDIACLIGGPNPALKSDQAYSQRHYEHVSGKYKDLSSEFLNIIAFLSIVSLLHHVYAFYGQECNLKLFPIDREEKIKELLTAHLLRR